MKNSNQLVVRFDSELLREIDKETERLKKKSDGVRITRSDTVRYLVKRGLEKSERK